MITTNDKTSNEITKLLREVLTQVFDINELRTLSFDYSIAENEISDQNGKTRVVQEMVGYAQRHAKLQHIWNYIAVNRPHVGFAMWDGSQPEVIVAPEKTQTDPTSRLNALLSQIALLTAEAQLELARLKTGT